jgi:hypothetical protein
MSEGASSVWFIKMIESQILKTFLADTIKEYIDLFHEACFEHSPKREVVDIIPKKNVKYQSDFE